MAVHVFQETRNRYYTVVINLPCLARTGGGPGNGFVQLLEYRRVIQLPAEGILVVVVRVVDIVQVGVHGLCIQARRAAMREQPVGPGLHRPGTEVPVTDGIELRQRVRDRQILGAVVLHDVRHIGVRAAALLHHLQVILHEPLHGAAIDLLRHLRVLFVRIRKRHDARIVTGRRLECRHGNQRPGFLGRQRIRPAGWHAFEIRTVGIEAAEQIVERPVFVHQHHHMLDVAQWFCSSHERLPGKRMPCWMNG